MARNYCLIPDELPDGMAVDQFIRKIFYTDPGNNVIAVMDTDGGNHETVIESGIDEPRTIVLDEKKRSLYWTAWGIFPNIAGANYDGTHRRTLVSTGIYVPTELAHDKQNGILYWCDVFTKKIESMTTDGRLRTSLLHKPDAKIFSLFVLDYRLYFGYLNGNLIMSMPVSGGEVMAIGSSAVSQVSGLYVISNRNETVCSPTDTVADIYQASVKKYKPN